MTYSKIFSGDLPELLNEIIQYFHHDYKTLHSCILVNRLWCRLAIPLLWEDPFSIPTLNYRFIDIYLSYLNEDCKLKLNEYGINNNLFPLNTFFNYPSFIQHLDTRKISNSIENWVTQLSYSVQNNNLQISNFTKLICSSLFLIFIENEVKLCSLEVSLLSHQVCEYFDEAFELILKNPNFIRDIKILKLDFYVAAETITKLLLFLNSNCNSISSLYFLFSSYYNNYSMNEKSLSLIIDFQENLKKILLGYNNFPLYHLLLSLKNSNCSNTLNTIVFYCIDFNNIIVFNEVFNQLNVLESVHIIYCLSLDIKFIQQIINVTKPFKLKSLFLNELLNIESLKLLIQKFGNNLEDFGIYITNITNLSQQLIQLFESVLKYCQKIKFLYLPFGLNNQNINLLFNLIDNIKQNLNYLRIDALNYDNHFSSNILQNLGKILPLKLEYLNLGLVINNNGNDLRENESDDIFPYIREYIMKKKRVKYLAISETINEKCLDLFSLKDKVKELELYDIQVLYYYNLYIDIYCFVKENYLQ
ncbi:hypothetical protein C1646_810922 [Rhizophagus diaphanus]|nr:hypothetical protein C1646_810922 [Rhizophagus diaphanus] [Rhizophagus sp. MUCL 43196]